MGREKKRGQWATKMGFILATAGAAVGLGNLWKFPYLMGKNGGFQFLAAYLVFVVILGLPVMITEMSIGRMTQRNPVDAYRTIDQKTTFIGVLGTLSAFVILSYYSVIGGWILKYITTYLTTFAAPSDFGSYIAQPVEPVIWHLVFMLAACIICCMGTSGIEKASTVMMPALFLILIVIIVRSLTLPNAGEGLRFIFSATGSQFSLGSLAAALGQVFYSLSLCMGITITYGSYLGRNSDIPKSCLTVAGLDTAVAILAGLAIFPAVFSFGLEPAQGPSLIFGTLPNVFAAIPGGVVFAILFFVLLFFAALTSAIALLECVISYAIDDLHWKRRKAVFLLGGAAFALGVPSALSYGVLADLYILNYSFFDLMGMLTDNILMPIGGIAMCIYVGWVWGPQKLAAHIESDGVTFRWKVAWLWCVRVITPVMIAVVTVIGFTGIYRTVTGG